MNDMVTSAKSVVTSARMRARRTATSAIRAATTTLSEGDDVPWKPLSLGQGPVNANLVQLRKYLRTMRGRYISIWQLAIIAVLLQVVVHYGGLCVGAYSIGSGYIQSSDYTVLCTVFVLVREFAPMVLVLIVCMPLPRRTLRLMDTLFEQIAAEETAQRTQIQMASVEWLADEKERAARREEALRWKLHHAEGDALKRQSELRQAQQEAKQYAFDASQHARRAAEWEGMLRQQEAAMAAAEDVTSKRVQAATRAVRSEFEAREREALRTIESLRLQLARSAAVTRSVGGGGSPRSGGSGAAGTTGLDGVRAAGVVVEDGADYGSGWGETDADEHDGGGGQGPLSPLSPLYPLRPMPLLPDTIDGDCPAAVKSPPNASPLGSPLGSPPLMRSPLRSPLRSPPAEEVAWSPPSSRPLVARLVESLAPLDPTAASDTAAASAAASAAAAAAAAAAAGSSSEPSLPSHVGPSACLQYAASTACATAATVATAAKARLEAQLAACCAGAAEQAATYFGSAEEGGAVIGEMLFGGGRVHQSIHESIGGCSGSAANEGDDDDDEHPDIMSQSPARLRPSAKNAEAAMQDVDVDGDGDGDGDGEGDGDGDGNYGGDGDCAGGGGGGGDDDDGAPNGHINGHPSDGHRPATLISRADADHRAPSRRPAAPVRGVRRLPSSRDRAGDEPAASGVLATVRRIAARMASETGCAPPAAAAEPTRTTLRCRRGSLPRRPSRGPPPSRSSSGQELRPITEDEIESVPNLDVSGLLAARRPLFHSPAGLNVKAVLV